MNETIQEELKALNELYSSIGDEPMVDLDYDILISFVEEAIKWVVDPVNNVRPSVDINFFYQSSK